MYESIVNDLKLGMLVFKIIGEVKKNVGRGKTLGFPTANIEAPKEARDGVYLGYTTIVSSFPNLPLQGEGKFEKLPSLLFIGAAVTFDESKRFAESYILDFHGELYGKIIEMEFVKYIRANRKFASVKKMQKQIEEDERTTRAYFGI